ncbi:glycosyltransferase family 2 protein [Belnapia sp. T6]|uniref:Glycosyltransferase family 2 protein n=1 Tax=Belnapia mucosa TaxID=2804532 RepID=A0ABS1V5V1_9PROT|nr:glycosyltransferase family 2 protein [Belnapia mucosa]MBL6456667.1 glycosyltransferase family 2 protein [Belnapia mucosa]
MSHEAPLVSVVVPCFNRAHLIPELLATVRGQTLPDWELVIVDDCSTEDLAAAVQACGPDPRIRLIRHESNRGAPAARNTGVAAARGRFIAFLDSDDSWRPEKLARQAEAVLAASDPDTIVCVTRTLVVLPEGRQIIRPLEGPRPGRSFGEFLYNDGGFFQSSAIFLAARLARQIRFREDLGQMEEHLFFMELGASGAAYLLVPEPLTIWHNDERPDRITHADDLAKWRRIMRQFEEHAAPLLPPHVLLAGEARFLSGHLWKAAPLESVGLLLRAWRHGALSARQVAALFCRNALPRSLYDSARQHWAKGRETSPAG